MNFLNKLAISVAVAGLSLFSNGVFAHGRGDHDPGKVKDVPNLPYSLDFIENKGQWETEVKYKATFGSSAVFLTEDGFMYNFAKQSDLDRVHELTCGAGANPEADLSKELIHRHAYRIRFEGSNKNARFHNENKRKYHHNYFIGNDESKWAGKVGLFGKVTQKEIYNGIDVSIYSTESQSLKYDFIVKAGANPALIKLSFDGVNPVISENGDLVINTSVNEVVERAPYTYQIINNQKVEVASNYKLDKKGNLTFEFPNGYDANYELIIDPELIFATYSGTIGSGSAFAYSTGYDSDGGTFAGALLNTGADWPVSPGAFMVAFPSNNCAGVNKYTPDGLGLIYSTFFGGTNGTTHPMVLRCNSSNELILGGVTSSTNIPTTSGAFQATHQGGNDLYITRFSFDGSALLGSTYVGTSAAEGNSLSGTHSPVGAIAITTSGLAQQNVTTCMEIAIDNTNNIWVGSSTSGNNFPLTSNAFQLTHGGGWDGVVFGLTPNCANLIFSSYIGGTGTDAVHSIVINKKGQILVAGATESQNFPTTPGAFNSVALGGRDGFVTLFIPTTGTVINSTFIGTDQLDMVSHVYTDDESNVYLLGRTQGAYPIHPSNVLVTNTGQNAMQIFVEKLDDSLKTSIQATVINGALHMFPTAFMVDICKNVYMALMFNGNYNGMPLTNDAFDFTPRKFWFGVLSENFTELLFGSYFGTTADDHNHTGVNCMDPNGIVYHSVCAAGNAWNALTGSSVFPTKQNNLSSQDIITFKFNFDKAGVNAEFKLDPNSNPRDSGCVPFMVNFANNSTQVVDFYWDFGDGGTSTLQSPSHTYTTPGTYTIELITVNDTACVTHDTAYLTVYVFQLDTPQLVVRDTVLCNPEDEIDIFVEILNPSSNTLGNIIRWTSNPQTAILTANDLDTVTVNPNLSLTYTVTVWDSIPHLCSAFRTAQVNIDLSPRELKMLTNDTTVCYGDTIQVRAVGTQGYTYHWTPATGVSDTTALEPEIVVTQPNIYILTSSYPFCLDTSVMFSVDVEHYPVVSIDAPKEACRYTEAVLNSNVTPFRNDYTYTWTPNTNLSNSNLPNTILTADTTATYRLTVRTPAGCTGSDEISIAVHPGNFGDAISDMGYCPPGEVELWATGGEQYRWTPSIGLSNDTIYNPKTNVSTTTTYTVYITDANNCEDTFDVIVTVYPLAVLSLPDSVVIHKGESYRVAPNTNCLYFNWFPPSGVSNPQSSDPDLNPIVRTKYYVTARTENGCETTDSMIVMVDGSKFEIPNAFAPGGGKVFKPINRGDATLNTFAVYNRWGNKIFETKNIDEGWDGTYNGAEQSAGVYVYIVDAIARDGEPIQMQGNVTLVR